MKYVKIFTLALATLAHSTAYSQSADVIRLADLRATKKTKALYANLKALAGEHLLFGHQDDLAYGVGWEEEVGRSDVKDVTGSYPAVYGWDIAHVGAERNIDGVSFEKMAGWIKEAYKRGGVITLSWHMENPVTHTHSWDTTRAVEHIIPGGKLHEEFKAELDTVADFIKELKVGLFGTDIPVIFRPFHEHTGAWFWWGYPHATAEEYVKLWKFTVEYLRDEKGLHNLLYAYSPDKFKSREEYLRFYPGDDYVDILGVDDYHGLANNETAVATIKRLHALSEIAEEKDKVAAITETGAESIPIDDWWTNVLLRAITTDEKTKNIAWVLVWRNDNKKHHYAPYKGHPSAEDFKKFKDKSYVLFEDELPDMYKMPKK